MNAARGAAHAMSSWGRSLRRPFMGLPVPGFSRPLLSWSWADGRGQGLVGFQNPASGHELVFYAARSYSLMTPPGAGGRGAVVVRCSAGRTSPGLTAGVVREDQHPVGDLGPGGEHDLSA